MRKQLLYDPLLLLERLGEWATKERRLRKLKRTAAAGLTTGHIGSLELLELLQASDIKVIYDIGANVGTWTLLAKSVFPDTEVHAFEPLNNHVLGFKSNIAALSKVTLHEVALSDKNGSVYMNVTSFSDASSILNLEEKYALEWGLTVEGKVEVPTETLDSRMTRLDLPLPDLVKLDIQGYELVALRGARSALTHAKAVLIEVSFSKLYCGQADFHEVVDFLAAHGFYLHAIGHGVAIGNRLSQADVLLTKSVKCT